MLHNVSPQLSYWLNYQHSLTERLSGLGFEIEVCVLKEWWFGEIFKRDVLIFCDKAPCWFGRTIMRKQTYQLKSKAFRNLGNDPIGSILYHSKDIKLQRRRFFSWHKHWYHPLPSVSDNAQLWARGSTFHIQNQSLFLMELFLPNLSDKVHICR